MSSLHCMLTRWGRDTITIADALAKPSFHMRLGSRRRQLLWQRSHMSRSPSLTASANPRRCFRRHPQVQTRRGGSGRCILWCVETQRHGCAILLRPLPPCEKSIDFITTLPHPRPIQSCQRGSRQDRFLCLPSACLQTSTLIRRGRGADVLSQSFFARGGSRS